MSEIKSINNGKRRILIDNFGGYNAKLSPFTKIPINEFPVMDNLYLYKGNDMLIKRGAITKFVTNLPHSTKAIVSIFEHILSTGENYILTKSNNGSSSKFSITNINGVAPLGVSWSDISTSEETGRFDMLSFKDKLYIANRNGGSSTNKVWYYNGGYTAGYLDMGCPPCNNALITSSTSGSTIPAGTYYYAVTYLYDDFQESAAMIKGILGSTFFYPFVVLASPKDITLAIPEGNTRVSAYKVYRSKVDDPSVYYYHTTVKDLTASGGFYTFLDTKLDDELGYAIEPSLLTGDMKKPYKSKYQTVHKDALVQANLKEDLYTPFSSGDVTVAASASGGALDAGAVYKYRFYKCWAINTGGDRARLLLSPYLEKSVTTSGTGAVDITFAATNPWCGLVVVQRTAGGTTDFKWILSTSGTDPNEWIYGKTINTSTYVDTVSDSNRYGDLADLTIAPSTTSFGSYVAISDTSKPDIFSTLEINTDGSIIPASNVFKVGQDDGDSITSIFSDYNKIVVFKDRSIHVINTSAQSKNFWFSTIVEEKVGASERCAVKIANGEYFFGKITTETSGKSSVKFYHWNIGGIPYEVSVKIDSLLNITGTFTIYDITYDSNKKWIYITLYNSANSRTYILIYDMSIRDENQFGLWYVWYNSVADLDCRGLYKLKDYGVVIGTGEGGLSNEKSAVYRDSISGTNRDIVVSLQSKTFDFEDSDFDLKEFKTIFYVGTGVDSSLGTINYTSKIDNESESTTALSSFTAGKIGKSKLSLTGSCSQYYFRIEAYGDVPFKILAMMLDVIPRFETEGGKTYGS